MRENPEYLQGWRLHSLCWKWFLVFDHLHGNSTPHPSTPLPVALFKSVSYVLVRTFNNVGPYIYPWGMLLVTIQSLYCQSQDTGPSDAASFLSPFHLSNSLIISVPLRIPWETVKHLTWAKVSNTSPAVHQIRQQPVWSGTIYLSLLIASLPLTFTSSAISPLSEHSK